MGNSDVIAVQNLFSGAEAVSLLSSLHILNTIRHKEATGKAPPPEARVPGRLLPLLPTSRPCWCHHAESKRPNGNSRRLNFFDDFSCHFTRFRRTADVVGDLFTLGNYLLNGIPYF